MFLTTINIHSLGLSHFCTSSGKSIKFGAIFTEIAVTDVKATVLLLAQGNALLAY